MIPKVRLTIAAGLVLGSLLAGGDAIAQAAVAPLPQRLSETGLFVAGSRDHVAPGILAFTPQYPLWSDGATKRRWIALPRGGFIDAARPDTWEFPRGTRLWKEFSLGRRVETRYIERLPDGAWRFATYVWSADGSDALLAPAVDPDPVILGDGRRYPIPSEADCRACHEGAAVPVLGFGALQLSADRDPLAPHAEPAGGVDLRALVARGWLRNLPTVLLDTPPRIVAASPVERAVLGYLHGNCAHCHSRPDDSAAAVPVGLLLAQTVAEVHGSRAVLSTLLAALSRFRPPGASQPAHIVAPGQSAASVLVQRMRSRDPRVQMPPLGTGLPDREALALVERWIDHNLPPR